MTRQYPNWAHDPLMRDYYDHYWGLPVHDERELFQMLTLELFQAGLSWSTVWQKRAAFNKAFANFDVQKIAAFGDQEVEDLMHNAAIIRNRRKIKATIHNAQVLLKYHAVGKTLDHFLWSFVDNQPIELHAQPETVLPSKTSLSIAIAKQMKKAGFQFTGPTIVFSLLCAVGVVNGRVE